MKRLIFLLYTTLNCTVVYVYSWFFVLYLLQSIFAHEKNKILYTSMHLKLSSALSCFFIVQQDQSNERFRNRIFLFSPSWLLYCDRLYMCILKHGSPWYLLLLVDLEAVRRICYCIHLRLPHDDVVVGLLVTSSRNLSVLVYLCNKHVIVIATDFVYCS